MQKIAIGIAVIALVVGGVAIYQVKGGALSGTSWQKESFVEGLYAGTGRQFQVTRAGVVSSSADASFSELNYLEKSESITADNTITAAESGTTFYVNTNVSTSTLPAVATATGTVYRFVIASAVSTNDFRVVSAEGDNIEGSLIVAGAVVDCDAADRINFVTDGENLGDYVEVRSNGQKWYVTQSNALTSAKLTCSG